jgi:hypothetical protein
MRSTKPHETARTQDSFRVISCRFVDRLSVPSRQSLLEPFLKRAALVAWCPLHLKMRAGFAGTHKA